MNISILGSTGSIGTQALEVVDDLRGIRDIGVVAITGNSNVRLLEEQARKYSPELVAVATPDNYGDLKARLADTDVRRRKSVVKILQKKTENEKFLCRCDKYTLLYDRMSGII